MEYKLVNSGFGYVIRLEKGERVMEQLAAFAGKKEITGAFFYGLGAVKNTELGKFDVEKNEYAFTELPEIMELASLNGSLSILDNRKPVVHAHAVLADGKLQAHAGHVKEMEVAVTCEIFMHLQHGVRMTRKPDGELNLNLLHFE